MNVHTLAFWIVFAVFVVALIGLLAKIIFDPKFRRDMLRQPGNGGEKGMFRIGPLSVQGGILLVLLVCLAYGLIFVAQELTAIPPIIPTSESEKVIRGYFEAINEGITGDSTIKAYERAWNLFTQAYQQQKRRKYPAYDFPTEYGKLYANSGHHKIVLCTPVAGTESEGLVVYYVVFKLTEPHFGNPFFEDFSPTTMKQLKDLPSMLAPGRIADVLLAKLNEHYIVPSTFPTSSFTERVDRIQLNSLISPRLLTELAAEYKLEEKPPAPGEPIGPAGSDIYEVYQGSKIRVARIGSNWRIDGIKISTFCGQRMGM